MRGTLLFGALLAGGAASAWAQSGTLDQSSPRTNATIVVTTPSFVWQQQIRPGLNGQLEGIRLVLEGDQGAGMTLQIRSGTAPSSSPVLFSTTVRKRTPNREEQFISMVSAQIQSHSGGPFVMEAFGNNDNISIVGSYVNPAVGPPLYPEPLYLGSAPYDPGFREGFDTFVIVSGGGGCYANCDGSSAVPFLNVNDFICFGGRFAAGDSRANCDGSTAPPVLNVNDFICFQQRFAAGCSAP